MTRAYYVPRRDFPDLLIGRIARLYPLHVLTLVWVLLLAFQKRQVVDVAYVLQSLLLLRRSWIKKRAKTHRRGEGACQAAF
jgi:peptidoglycan/LPS O-acetylase OafA/YrhL